MQVTWNRCDGHIWCKLNTVDLTDNHFDSMTGVYVIWHGGNNPKTVRVGQGFIKDRIAAHRLDPEVQDYAQHGLFVTWASLPGHLRNGVEAYLAQQLNPLVGDRFPNAPTIAVNLPW